MNIHPIFNDCVAKHASRNAITAPWLRDGMVYATNGQILVRCPHTPAIGDVPPVELPPPTAELFLGKTWPIKLAIGELPPPLAQVKCEMCRGKEHAICDMGHKHPCKNCAGTGLEDAPPRPLRVSATQCLGEGYARLLVRHGAELFATERGGKDPLLFTVGGDIEGLVMPMQASNELEPAVDVRGATPSPVTARAARRRD